MAKLPTRSPTHEDVPPGRLAAMGLELEDIADGDEVATELRVAPPAPVTVRVCVGTCQRWGALEIMEHLVGLLAGPGAPRLAIAPVSCLDRCDLAPACEIHGAHGQLVIAPATRSAVDEALRQLVD
jgi:NADH:ubiquinone oxidoreductase subunit E